MQVITFYSYKGGMGRTLACANFGLYLAKTGQKVVLADMDFEAPGLDSKFPGVEMSELSGGLLEQFTAFQNDLEIPELKAVDIALTEDVARSGGRLQLIPAGNYMSPDYYKNLSGLRWEELLADEVGLAFCIDLVKRIEKNFEADVLLIDSRTGLTEVGGLCTQILPDTVILLTNTSRESLKGTRRIHEHIRKSAIVKSRLHGRTKVDIRVVMARIPRPEDLPSFERSIRDRLDIPTERLFYLFDQHDLCFEEYLAMDRIEERPAILDDYVELFASFNPETTLPYVEERLDGFRSQLTRRSIRENDRIIQELLILFPRPEVMLEAARYYRLAKDGDTQAVANYIRYLDCRRDDSEILVEFADLCTTVPEGELKPRDKVALHLRAFGVDRMGANLLVRFFRLSQEEDWQDIVDAIEKDEPKMADEDFRETYFKTLRSLGKWDRIIANALDRDQRSRSLSLLLAEAFSHAGRTKEVLRIIRDYRPEDPEEAFSLLSVIFMVTPNVDLNTVMKMTPNVTEYYLGLDLRRFLGLGSIKNEDPDFSNWLGKLHRQYHNL